MKNQIEYRFSSVPSEKLFLEVIDQLVKTSSGKVVNTLDGLDEKYWDIQFEDEILTLHSETYIGIVAFMKNGSPFSDITFSVLQRTKSLIFKDIRALERAFPRITKSLASLFEDLASGRFDSITKSPFQSRCMPKDVERTIKEYGRKIVQMPEHEIESAELLILKDGSGFVGDICFWTAEEGRSDLSLIFTIEQDKISIDDIRVM